MILAPAAHTFCRAGRRARSVPFVLARLLTPFALLCCFLLAPPAHAQVQDDADVIEVRTDLVVVPAVVTDRRRGFVTDLTRSDFRLFDEDRPATIELFAAGIERLRLVFAFDASGSIREQIARQEPAARLLLARFSPASPVAVLHFDDAPRLAAEFTTDAETIRRAFTISALPDRRTAIFDAALAAVRLFDRDPSREPERRVVILVSDGLDNRSATAPRAVIYEAERRGIAFYVIHLPLYAPHDGGLAPRAPAKGFRDLARSTGGEYYLVGDARDALDPNRAYDFTPVFERIAAELRAQYVLGFYPPTDAPAGERRIRLELTGRRKRGLRLRALRQSYTRAPTVASRD